MPKPSRPSKRASAGAKRTGVGKAATGRSGSQRRAPGAAKGTPRRATPPKRSAATGATRSATRAARPAKGAAKTSATRNRAAPRERDRASREPQRAPRRGAAPKRASPAKPGRARARAEATAPRGVDPSLPPLPWPLQQELKTVTASARVEEAMAAMQRAVAAFDRGDLGKASGEARRAKEASPRSPSVREALGLIYHARKDYKGALAELQAFRRISGSPLQDPVVAECYLAVGRPEKALEILMVLQREAVDERAWVESQITRAKAHEKLGHMDAAVGLLRVLDADPRISEGNHLRARYELAEMLERTGNREDARQLFARIAVKAPAYRDALERAR